MLFLKMQKFNPVVINFRNQTRNFKFGNALNAVENIESPRMQEFHKKLKLEKIPRVPPTMRFIDLMLVDTDPENGELIPNSEKNPTKWGDWQHHGRVTDF